LKVPDGIFFCNLTWQKGTRYLSFVRTLIPFMRALHFPKVLPQNIHALWIRFQYEFWWGEVTNIQHIAIIYYFQTLLDSLLSPCVKIKPNTMLQY
jgi:hypothetical protein